MHRLLLFLVRYSAPGLFLLLEIVSFSLFVNNGRYAGSVFFSSSNAVIGRIYTVSGYVSDFFKLRLNNEELNEENVRLKNYVVDLENRLALAQAGLSDTVYFVEPEKEAEYIAARIVHNTTNRMLNYITLNRGAADGVTSDMGVVGAQGVVGIVRATSERFSTVVSLLNPTMQVSCKIKRSGSPGFLSWDGHDYRYAHLTDILRHENVYKGDTVVTSGLTTTFPEGLLVGIIEEFTLDEGSASYDIKVRLATDFRRVSDVKVIRYLNREEQETLEQQNEAPEKHLF